MQVSCYSLYSLLSDAKCQRCKAVPANEAKDTYEQFVLPWPLPWSHWLVSMLGQLITLTLVILGNQVCHGINQIKSAVARIHVMQSVMIVRLSTHCHCLTAAQCRRLTDNAGMADVADYLHFVARCLCLLPSCTAGSTANCQCICTRVQQAPWHTCSCSLHIQQAGCYTSIIS